MALLRCDFFSDVLEMGASMTVVLPQLAASEIGIVGSPPPERGYPVLYLLHGLSDDATAWSRRTSIERYATERGVAVVMPAVARSFYADEAHGYPYWTYLSEELPEIVARFLRVSTVRADTFVAGLSMGGYGAMKWALRQPERFAAAASMSGALDIARLLTVPERGALFEKVFDNRIGPGDDLLDLLGRATPADLPALWVGCGTEDVLLESNRAFVRTAEKHGIDVTTQFEPGAHEWVLWDRAVQDVLAWLPVATGPPSLG